MHGWRGHLGVVAIAERVSCGKEISGGAQTDAFAFMFYVVLNSVPKLVVVCKWPTASRVDRAKPPNRLHLHPFDPRILAVVVGRDVCGMAFVDVPFQGRVFVADRIVRPEIRREGDVPFDFRVLGFIDVNVVRPHAVAVCPNTNRLR